MGLSQRAKNKISGDGKKESKKIYASTSLVEKMANAGPIPKDETKPLIPILNLILIACILPIIAYLYYQITQKSLIILPEGITDISVELIVIWITIFLFSYTFLVYHASGRFKRFISNIKPCLTLDEKKFEDFKRENINSTFKPPYLLLILFLLTGPVLTYGITTTPYFTGDIVVAIILTLILSYCGFLHWVASWMIYSFLKMSSRFGRGIPLKVNPFDPDGVGGLMPLSDLSTIAIFDVGFLSLLVIPLWEIFLPSASYVMIFCTSILLPTYFLLSMRGIYDRLKEEKDQALFELNDEIQYLSGRIRGFICKNHCEEKFDDAEILSISQTLNAVEIIHSRIKSMHTFPVNAEIMAKIFLSAILPIFAVLLEIIQTLLF